MRTREPPSGTGGARVSKRLPAQLGHLEQFPPEWNLREPKHINMGQTDKGFVRVERGHMGQGGFEVGSDLEAHASQLDGLTDQLNQAVDAARQVSMPTDAYGILCQPFRVLLDPVEQYGINALQDAVTAMESVADKVRKTAQAYQDNDSGVGTTLKQYEA